MKRIVIYIFILTSSIAIFAQDAKVGIKFSGFIKNDFFMDSRQTVTAREGHFLLWPSAPENDANGNDINARSSVNLLSLQSRLKVAITGPDAFGAKTLGVVEGDFFAQSNDNINLFRMRHAFIKLNWEKAELLTGQYWNPLFVTDCFPGTVSFNTGTPLQSFARNPQIRFTYAMGALKIVAAHLAQRDYTSRGPDGINSSYLRNSSLPDVHLQLQYGSDKIKAGAGAAYKIIVPRLKSTVGENIYQVNEKVAGLSALAYAKITTKPVTIKLEARYGENLADVLAISGFAVKEVLNSTTGQLSYTPLKSMTYWGEIHTNGKVQLGLFAGYTSNLGAKESMSDKSNAVYGLGTNISNLWRISPRLIFNSGKTRLAFELETTTATYGSDFDVNYKASSFSTVTNIRGLIAMYYFF
ncbi:MAG: hypothetical protein PF541_18485 [Prolixibacteraceae bacterium]|jgi:hypothetical protein|nr:hypothetical protein [Prolixibacteraceae bacterium]